MYQNWQGKLLFNNNIQHIEYWLRTSLRSKSDTSRWEYSSGAGTRVPLMFRNKRYPSASAALDDYICTFEGKDSSVSVVREKYQREVRHTYLVLAIGCLFFMASTKCGVLMLWIIWINYNKNVNFPKIAPKMVILVHLFVFVLWVVREKGELCTEAKYSDILHTYLVV